MLRNALIVTQFVIAIVLICSTIIIYQQFNHLRTAPLVIIPLLLSVFLSKMMKREKALLLKCVPGLHHNLQ